MTLQGARVSTCDAGSTTHQGNDPLLWCQQVRNRIDEAAADRYNSCRLSYFARETPTNPPYSLVRQLRRSWKIWFACVLGLMLRWINPPDHAINFWKPELSARGQKGRHLDVGEDSILFLETQLRKEPKP